MTKGKEKKENRNEKVPVKGNVNKRERKRVMNTEEG
jgi:hypothetical protein